MYPICKSSSILRSIYLFYFRIENADIKSLYITKRNINIQTRPKDPHFSNNEQSFTFILKPKLFLEENKQSVTRDEQYYSRLKLCMHQERKGTT